MSSIILNIFTVIGFVLTIVLGLITIANVITANPGSRERATQNPRSVSGIAIRISTWLLESPSSFLYRPLWPRRVNDLPLQPTTREGFYSFYEIPMRDLVIQMNLSPRKKKFFSYAWTGFGIWSVIGIILIWAFAFFGIIWLALIWAAIEFFGILFFSFVFTEMSNSKYLDRYVLRIVGNNFYGRHTIGPLPLKNYQNTICKVGVFFTQIISVFRENEAVDERVVAIYPTILRFLPGHVGPDALMPIIDKFIKTHGKMDTPPSPEGSSHQPSAPETAATLSGVAEDE